MSTSLHSMFAKDIAASVPTFLPEHLADIQQMGESYAVVVKDDYIETHVCAFTELGRDSDYATVSPGTDADKPNCRAYPLPNGAWRISQYHRRAEQEKPGWGNNQHGWASRVYPGPKPTIDLNAPEIEQQRQAIAALASRPNVYQRNEQLVRIVVGTPKPLHALRETQPPSIAPLPLSELAVELDTAAEFVKWDARARANKKTSVPVRLVQSVAGAASYAGIRSLESVIHSPRFLASGEILSTPGYHAATGLFYQPESPESLFGNPVSVSEAIDCINEVLCDFPFAAAEHKSVVFSGILSVFARSAYHGPCPLHLIEGNSPGVGKGLLVDVMGEISSGQSLPRTTANGRDDDELRKTITAIVARGNSLVLLDNLSGNVDSAALAALLTSTTWQGRWLCRSETIIMPWNGVVYATGNNLMLSTDLSRRTLYARLSSPLENPDERTDFRHPRLLNSVRALRKELVTAALSLLHHWHHAGRQKPQLPAFGSYEAWSDVVRSCIVWAGLPDPVSTRAELRESNSDNEILSLLLDGWNEADPERNGLTAAQAFDLAHQADKGKPRYPTLAAVVDALPGGDKKQQLAYALRKYNGVVRNQQTFDKVKGRATIWKVRAA